MKLSLFFAGPVSTWLASKQCKDPWHYGRPVKLWIEFFGDLPVNELTQDMATAFPDKLTSQTSLIPGTIYSYCRYMNTVLEFAGPPSRHMPEGMGLIGDIIIPLPEIDRTETDQKTRLRQWANKQQRGDGDADQAETRKETP